MKIFLGTCMVVCSLFVLSGCDTSNPMLQPLPAQSVPAPVVTPTVVTPTTPATPTPPTSTPAPKPASNGYTMQDVQQHNTANDCWTVIYGKIYNMSSFSRRHSGGSQSILAVCGIDGTSIYSQQHGSRTSLIQSFFVANLQ